MVGFNDSAALSRFSESKGELKTMLAGVIFDGMQQDGSVRDGKLEVTYRFHADPVNRDANNRDRFGAV